MKILSYRSAKDIPEYILPSLVQSEIECWGLEPFSEYKICNDCKAIFSIEEVHGGLKDFRKNIGSGDTFKCLECNGTTNYIYEPSKFLEEVKEYIKGDVSSILLLTPEEKIEGFGILSKTTISGLIENEFATRPGSYDAEKISTLLSKKIFGVNNAFYEEIICFHQIYVSSIVREGNISLDMLKKLFSLNNRYNDMPVVGEAKYDNRFYPISRSMGFKNIMDDKYGYVIQFIKNYGIMLKFLEEHSGYTGKNLISNMIKYKKESLKILKGNKLLKERKIYK